MFVMAKKKPGRARETGATRTITFEIDPPLDDALKACAEFEDRTQRATIIRALKAYLSSQGFWSVKGEGSKE